MPGVADGPEQIDELVTFVKDCGKSCWKRGKGEPFATGFMRGLRGP
jgi:hypothetical protein